MVPIPSTTCRAICEAGAPAHSCLNEMPAAKRVLEEQLLSKRGREWKGSEPAYDKIFQDS